METEINNEQKENRGLYWVIFFASTAVCITLLLYKPEFFWIALPFVFTYFVKAVGMM